MTLSLASIPASERTLENLLQVPATSSNYEELKTAVLDCCRSEKAYRRLYRPQNTSCDAWMWNIRPEAVKLLKNLAQMPVAEKTDDLTRAIFEATKYKALDIPSTRRQYEQQNLLPLEETEEESGMLR